MKTTSAARNHRRGLAGLILVGAAALSGAHDTPASPQHMARSATMLDSSHDLLTLHRYADPSPFRCSLCRLAPQLRSSASIRINNPRNCDSDPARMSQL